MKNQKVIIALLSCLISMPVFAEGFNVNKEISSSVKEAVLDSAFSMPQKKSQKPTAFSRYKAMEFSIREGKMSELKKILKEGALPDLIKWYDKNGQEKVAAYDRDIYPEKDKWFALKPYETLFVTATLVRNKKAMSILLDHIKNGEVIENQILATMDNLLKYHNTEDFEFFHQFVASNALLKKYISGKDIIALIALASSSKFYNGEILDILINDYLSIGTPAELVKNLVVYVNRLPGMMYDAQGKGEKYIFNSKVFYEHLDQNKIQEITLEDKCSFIDDVVSSWRSVSQILGDVYDEDDYLFPDTFNYLLDSLDLKADQKALDDFTRGASFQWTEADFDGVIHDKVTMKPCTKFFYNLRDSEKGPWARKFNIRYGFEKTAIFVPLKFEK